MTITCQDCGATWTILDTPPECYTQGHHHQTESGTPVTYDSRLDGA